jgi:hypothetical protein
MQQYRGMHLAFLRYISEANSRPGGAAADFKKISSVSGV